MDPFDLALLVGAVVALVAIGAARLGSRLGLPALLLFLGVGMALGSPQIGGITFNDADLALSLGFAALVLILAEGGLSTKWETIRPALGLATVLATIGVLVSIGLVGAFAHFVLGVPWTVAFLFGAVTAPTDSAAVFSVLRNVSLPARLRAALEAESGLNDAPVVLLTIVFTQMALGRRAEHGIAVQLLIILLELAGGLLLGAVVGVVAAFIMRRVPLPSSGLYAIAALSWAVLAYALGVATHLSGFAAVYVCALVIGNAGLTHRHSVRSFAEGIGWIAQIGLFVMLGVLATPERLTWQAVTAGVLGGLFLTFIARPLAVVLCAAPFRLPWQEVAFLSWAGLRGAVPIILCTIPLAAKLPAADMLFDIVLVFVIVFTAIQAPTLAWIGAKLGLVDPSGPSDVEIEAAPIDKLRADLLSVRVPAGSHLAGVAVHELRMPTNAVVSLVVRQGRPFAPNGRDVLQEGDEMLVVTAPNQRRQVEERLTEIGRGGRLARWRGYRAV
ncbi:potassium/proton antiporter [Aestuariimicrobium ganziense]|uniref:potassium/proton antiporter n=1 Tax=Aestuariimicrobium ganziense TaxID=2773677 RepID=UPI001943C4FF|nr:potassium/proton antiporter [Aestuariimicrobium ganziense]